MSDLRLIDELLIDLRSELKCTFTELTQHSTATRAAMDRLRVAWYSGEVKALTMSLARYFRETFREEPDDER